MIKLNDIEKYARFRSQDGQHERIITNIRFGLVHMTLYGIHPKTRTMTTLSSGIFGSVSHFIEFLNNNQYRKI